MSQVILLAEPDFCQVKQLPDSLVIQAARTAHRINPNNRPSRKTLDRLHSLDFEPGYLALVTAKYWGIGGVNLSVQFLGSVAASVRDRILLHMNAWGAYCNAKFAWTQQQGQVRIAFGQDGYWSYLGTDITHIPANQPTMNLQGFDSVNNAPPESEWHRVVRHETGHTLGFPHEHMRRELVARLDVAKTIAWGRQQLGWSETMVRQQILTPITEASIRGTPNADQDSIMCYQLPGSITLDGQPIRGGTDIDALDQGFAVSIYPGTVQPPPPPPPPPGGEWTITIKGTGAKPTVAVT